MSSIHVNAVADCIIRDPATFASLPQPVAQRIFLALPAVARGRASCVCRTWRDVLTDTSLWTRLDLSFVSREEQRFLAVLQGAADRAKGRLCQLERSTDHFAWNALLPVLTANAGSLRELHLQSVADVDANNNQTPTVEAIVAAAPLLQVLMAENVYCSWKDAPRMLRAEPPFAPLQMRCELTVRFAEHFVVGGMERFGPFAAALADATLQPVLQHVWVLGADTAQPALMGALVYAAVGRRLRELTLEFCTPPAAAPLARLLAQGSLTALELYPADDAVSIALFDADGAALVADALRVNTTLTKLLLCDADLCADIRVAELLLGALVGHLSLRELHIFEENTTEENRIAFGTALAALIAADAPALQLLNCSSNRLGDVGLAPIVEVLALNRHLRELDVGYNGMSEAFVLERLLPAVRANTTLCELKCASRDSEPAAAAEAEELVRRRGQHA
jgi:hypothetical protein